MTRSNLGALFVVMAATAALPLACGDDEAPPPGHDDGVSGSAPRPTGGTGADVGPSGGGGAGDSTGGADTTSGGAATSGGMGGRAGADGKSAGGTTSRGGTTAEGGASNGGSGGAPGGGEGGEGWSNESVERAKRICEKTKPLHCPDESMCVEDFRWLFFAYPHCGPVSERMLICLDTQGTIEDFACNFDKPSFNGIGFVHCGTEFHAANDAGCLL